MRILISLLAAVLVFSSTALGFTIDTSLTTNSSNVLVDTERHIVIQSTAGETEEVVATLAARTDYSLRFQALGGQVAYQNTFGYGEGLQTTTTAFAFEGGEGLINQVQFNEKVGYESITAQVGDSELGQFLAYGFNPHIGDVTINYFGAAAGTRGRAEEVEAYLSGTTVEPGSLSLDAAAIGVAGRVGGSALAIERSEIAISDLQISRGNQFYQRSFTIQGADVEFDFNITIGD